MAVKINMDPPKRKVASIERIETIAPPIKGPKPVPIAEMLEAIPKLFPILSRLVPRLILELISGIIPPVANPAPTRKRRNCAGFFAMAESRVNIPATRRSKKRSCR